MHLNDKENVASGDLHVHNSLYGRLKSHAHEEDDDDVPERDVVLLGRGCTRPTGLGLNYGTSIPTKTKLS